MFWGTSGDCPCGSPGEERLFQRHSWGYSSDSALRERMSMRYLTAPLVGLLLVGCSNRPCGTQDEPRLLLPVEAKCPTGPTAELLDTLEAENADSEFYNWSAPGGTTKGKPNRRSEQPDTVRLLRSRLTAALTLCWYERPREQGMGAAAGMGGVFGSQSCTDGETSRDRSLEAALACDTSSLSASSYHVEDVSIAGGSMCRDGELLPLDVNVVVMESPTEPFDCPTMSEGRPFVGRDIYPPCRVCEYLVEQKWECPPRGLGSTGVFGP